MKNRQLVENSFLNEHISKKDIDELLQKGIFSIKKFYSNEILHIDGEICNYLEVVLEGSIKNSMIDSSGEEFLEYIFKKTIRLVPVFYLLKIHSIHLPILHNHLVIC